MQFKDQNNITLADTIEGMQSPDYKERFLAEYIQLRIRLEKLKAMLEDYRNNRLTFTPNCSYDVLHEQLIYMENYERSLYVRGGIEKIDLPKLGYVKSSNSVFLINA